jgi:hypothetical protein
VGIVVRPPTHRDVLGPLHPLDECLGRRRKQELIVRHGNKAKLGIETCILLNFETCLTWRARAQADGIDPDRELLYRLVGLKGD